MMPSDFTNHKIHNIVHRNVAMAKHGDQSQIIYQPYWQFDFPSTFSITVYQELQECVGNGKSLQINK